MAQAKRLARLLAALLSVGCLLLSLVLASKIGFLGFAIGGWTGLKGYEQAIVNARHMADVSIAQLAALQLIGGVIMFLGFRRKLGLAWSPVFVGGFSCATFVAWMVFVEIGTALHDARVSGW
jgi:hypothetical protein